MESPFYPPDHGHIVTLPLSSRYLIVLKIRALKNSRYQTYLSVLKCHNNFKGCQGNRAVTGWSWSRDKDGYFNSSNFFSKGGAYHGQLTYIGEQQLFDLGCRLRKRYINELNFLSQNYDPNEISVRSTNVKRCINSAKCLLAGLYLNSMHIDNNGLK